MKIQISDHFTYGRLFKFVISSVVMMIFTSIYSVVDGLFVANIVGSNALSSINIVMPLIMIVGAFGFMLGTGGGAEISKTIGQGDLKKANEYFTMLIVTIISVGVVLSILCIVFMKPICYFLGASELLIDDCVKYGKILIFGSTLFMLQTSFQTFYIIAEKPHIALALTTASGIVNIVLDYVFVYVMNLGISGAGLATVCGYVVGSVIPLIYFMTSKSSKLHFTTLKMYPKVLLHSVVNGSSEMLTNISSSIVTFLYNKQMMNLIGEDGVASITVIMYINFIFIAIYLGFSMGVAPIVGYNYGANNQEELQNIFKKGIRVIGGMAIVMTIFSQIVAVPLVSLFLGKDNPLSSMTVQGFRIYSLSFLICGVNIFGSSFFTALCNGLISAVISTLRSLVFQSCMILILPVLFEINGIWSSVVVAEALTLIVTIFCLVRNKNRYHYF